MKSSDSMSENQIMIYGPNVDPEKYQGDLGNFMYFLCIIGLTLIPMEVFLEDLVVK